MTINTLIIYIISSIILNITLNKLEKNTPNSLIDYIVISNIYIIILSGIFGVYNLTNNNDNIFLIILFQLLGKIFYLTLIKERTILRNNNYTLKKYLITLISSYLINILIINKIDNIFPSIENIKLIIWFFIIGYIALYIKKNITIKTTINNNITFSQDKEYIVMQYAKYKNKYFDIVSTKQEELNLLIYSIMIYENYNKPELMRKLDNLKYKIFKEVGTFGIMQIEKNKPITDEKSIEIAKKKLEKIYTSSKDKNNIKTIIKKYYKKDIKEIEDIYKIINNFTKI